MKLSVAMITYNQERFIRQAIESVLAQKVNFDYEIVVGEDCSTDLTRSVLVDFHRRYPNRFVPLLRERNLGGPDNFIGTLAACRGQYLAILEGDDYWISSDKLQRQVDFLDAHPDRAICCHRVQFLSETSSGEPYIFPSRVAGPYTIEDLLKGNFVMTCSTVLRRDLMGPLPDWFSKSKLGDWPLFALVARHGKIELMDDIMAVYRMHSGSTWSSMSSLARFELSTQMLKTIDEYLGFEYTNTIRQTLADSYLEMASVVRHQGKRMETARHLISCLLKGGWQAPGSRRRLAGLAAYTILGSWYKVFSRVNSANGNEPS
jgi:glycosyltransferase involved in cell wall biosynthesis